MNQSTFRHILAAATFLAFSLLPALAAAACASPTANAGSMNWNGTAMQVCDGTSWNNLGGASSSIKAWVAYNAASCTSAGSSCTIYSSSNVSSVTMDHLEGNFPVYLITFASAMSDTNYATIGSVQQSGYCTTVTFDDNGAPGSTSSKSVRAVNTCGSTLYPGYMNVMFLR